MLSTETIDIVKSTVPLLEEHGELITSTFYKNLLETSPELKHIFNPANQRDDSQSRALADAVLAYAGNLNNLEVLLPAVKRIANKHASLGILPEHYPIVGNCLLNTIQSVAELPDNHPALTAWGEAYGVLAAVFTSTEEQLYNDTAAAKGGWNGFREFTIQQVVTETPEVNSLVLVPSDGQPMISFEGGQYISVKLPASKDGFDQIRQYSLSEWSAEPSQYRISVKKESLGNVSNNMHNFEQGDTVLLSAPYGQFTLNPDATEQVFIAGGIGITPLFTMLQQAVEQGKSTPLTFINCSRDETHQVFNDQLAQLETLVSVKRVLEAGETGDFTGRLNEEILSQWLANTSADVYFCGPIPFMKSLKTMLNNIGFADEQLHYEAFGPTPAL